MKAVLWDLNDYSIRWIYFALVLWVLVFDTQTTAQSETVTESRPICPRGYDGPACNDIDECKEIPLPCQQICSNTDGSYTCSCNSSYDLAPDKHSCSDVNECIKGTSGCNQTCSNTDGSYTCSCNAGYRLATDGRSCDDIDECMPNTSRCAQNCFNTVGSYTCGCRAGYHLAINGLSCNDIDECNSTHLNNCSALENFTCDNTIGGFQCVCKTGFESVGPRQCRDINECEILTNNTCTRYENMTCENLIGSYKCRPRETSDAAAKVAIAVTICLVLGISLIIIAVVCFVRRAKKRKRNEEVTDPTANKTVLATTNVYDNKAPDSTPSESKCSLRQANSEILYEEFDGSQVTNTSTFQLEPSETVYENYAEASKPKTKPKPRPKPKSKPSDLNTQEPCCSTNVSCSTPGLPASGKADSKEAATGQSILANVYKGIQKVFKFQKGNKDLQNAEATNESIYQDLVPVTEMNDVYEPIRKPSKSNEVDESV